MTIAVGIDASGRRIGYAVVGVDAEEPLGVGVVLLPAEDATRNLVRQWRLVARKARGIAGQARADIVVVGVEDVYLGPNRRGALDHALVVGGVLALAQSSFADALILPVPAAKWRKHIGAPRGGKQAAMEWATRRLGHDVGQDEADALAIASTSAAAWRGTLQ